MNNDYASLPLAERMSYAATLAKAGDMIPKGLWFPSYKNDDGVMVMSAPSPAKIFLVLETGSSLGLTATASLQSINVIEGKAEIAPRAAGGLARKPGHKVEIIKTGAVSTGDYSVTVRITRADDGTVHESSYSLDRAVRAELCTLIKNDDGTYRVSATSKDGKALPWQKDTEDMVLWRAMGRAVREGAPEVLMDAPYIQGEIERSEVPLSAPLAIEATRDWQAAIDAATTSEQAAAVIKEAVAAGEITEDIRTKALARAGSLKRAEQEAAAEPEQSASEAPAEAEATAVVAEVVAPVEEYPAPAVTDADAEYAAKLEALQGA